ncbi:MAG: hypothetical protein GY720_07995 [bacterium]|nr:hypothetical protein [bacterium]
MSFDLILMDKAASESWDDALERAESLASSEVILSPARMTQWASTAAALAEHGYEKFDGVGFMELTQPEMAIQIHLSEVGIP